MKNTSECNNLKWEDWEDWEDPESSFWNYGIVCEHDERFACEHRLKLIASQQKEEFKKMCEGMKKGYPSQDEFKKGNNAVIKAEKISMYNQALTDILNKLYENK